MNGNGINGSNGSNGSREIITSDHSAAVVMPRILPTLDAEFGGPRQEYVSLAAYWHILLKRRWTVFTVALALVTLVAMVSFKMKPIYKATARVQVEAETPMIQSINEVFQKTQADSEFLQTQIQVVKSENLAWRTIEQLGLAQHLIAQEKLAKMEPDKRKVRLISAFKDDLKVELVPKTRMILVSYESPDPRLAAQVATTLVNNYIDYNFRQKYDATRQASGWMEQQLDELKARVEKSQQDLVAYERQNQIVNTTEKQNVVGQVLADLSRDLTVAESDRLQKEAIYREVMANPSHMASLAHNDLLQKLEEKSADLRGQYAEVLAQYGPKFPKAQRLQEQIRENQAQIEREQHRVMERIRKDYRTAVNRERLATAAVVAQKQEVGKLNQLLVQHNILQRDFDSNQQLYQSLLQRLKDATVSAGLRSANIHMVDSALPPTSPVRPKKLLNIAIGFLAGVILGMIGAFAQEGLDHSIKSAEEVEVLLATPALAIIPLDRSGMVAHRSLLARVSSSGKRETRTSSDSVALTISTKPQSVLAEAYRSLRTAILLSVAPNAPKMLLITSPHAGEGKTATALNLAQTMAQRKGPVLIMDCDLRKGSIAKLLGISYEKGVSTVLTGGDSIENALQQCALQPNLWVLPSGPVPPNPAELLSSDTMATLCTELASRFEHIIIDSPPVLAVTDATILSSLAGGVVLVVESGATPRGALLRTRNVLENAGARILGVVMNKLDLRQQGYYGNYGHYSYNHYYSSYPYGRDSSESAATPEGTRPVAS